MLALLSRPYHCQHLCSFQQKNNYCDGSKVGGRGSGVKAVTFRLRIYVDQGQMCRGCAAPVRQHDRVQSNWPVGRRVLVSHLTVGTLHNKDTCPLMITVNYNFLLPASS